MEPEFAEAVAAVMDHRHEQPVMTPCFMLWLAQLPHVESALTGEPPTGHFLRRRGDRYVAHSNRGIPLGDFVFDPNNYTPGKQWLATSKN